MSATRISIPKPDVKVTIATRTVNPTAATPALPALIMGPCFQVLDPQLSEGLTVNPDALVELPAVVRSFGQAIDLVYAGGHTATITVVANGVSVSKTYSGSAGDTYELTEIASDLNSLFASKGASARAEVKGSAGATRFVIYTTTKGSGNYIEVTISGTDATEMKTALKLPSKHRQDGYSYYRQTRQVFESSHYPDPFGIIENLTIDYNTVRLFADFGASGLSEWLRTTTVERCGTASIAYEEDGDLDGYTPLVRLNGDTITTPAPADDNNSGGAGLPRWIGLVNLGTTGTKADMTWSTFPGSLTVSGGLTLTVSGCTQVISLTSGMTLSNVIDAINAYFPNLASNNTGKLRLNIDGLTSDVPELQTYGRESCIIAEGPAQLLEDLFGGGGTPPTTPPQVVRGTWRPTHVQSQLYVDGTFVGNIIEIISTANAGAGGSLVRLDRELPVSAAAVRDFYIVETNLPVTDSGISSPWPFIGTASYAAPDLYIGDGSRFPLGEVRVKNDLLRGGSDGGPQTTPLTGATAAVNVYMGYTGLRLDVTPQADDPDLVAFNSATDLVSELPPVDTTNPLALGIYFAMINSPGLTTYGIGVSEVTDSYPEGTLGAYTEAAEFIESKDVYSIVPLTHNEDVAKMLQIHVDSMSDPDAKGERILWWCPEYPERERSTLIASGPRLNSGAPSGPDVWVNSGLADLPTRLTAAGITLSSNPEADLVYIQLASQGSKKWAVLEVSGPLIHLTQYVAGAGGWYTGALDGVFEATWWSGSLVDEPFTMAKLGASLYSGTVYNKQKAAEALHDLGQEFADRRVRMVIPDEVISTVGGLESTIPGYYACCCLAGMKAAKNPSQGFTNLAIGGLNGVQKTQGFFKESQLNLIAGGGGWILIPNTVSGGGVVTRMSLTTDTSTVEYRQDSFTSALDYGAKYIRATLRRIIGPTNITQASIDLVTSLVDGCLKYLVEAFIWSEGVLESVTQSSTSPDTLEIGITAKVPYNLNYISVTITV